MAKPACHTVGILVGVGMDVTLERGLAGDVMSRGDTSPAEGLTLPAGWGDVTRGGGQCCLG